VIVHLTTAQVLFIHARLIAETGGSPGLRDLGLLEAAVARPRATFDGALLYPDPISQAAALMESLVQNHPFVDGNKRVGITAAALFLIRNGIPFAATNDELEEFTLAVARSELSLRDIAAWFDAHSASGPEV
jgi:death on curing protein